jgi:hypothetical protein
MTKKEKIISAEFQSFETFKTIDIKDLLKFIHTKNPDFEDMSPFAWSEHNHGKKLKTKLNRLYNEQKTTSAAK